MSGDENQGFQQAAEAVERLAALTARLGSDADRHYVAFKVCINVAESMNGIAQQCVENPHASILSVIPALQQLMLRLSVVSSSVSQIAEKSGDLPTDVDGVQAVFSELNMILAQYTMVARLEHEFTNPPDENN